MSPSTRMNPERGGNTRTPSRRRSHVAGTCRTCKGCRQKKVKCDGQRPKCGACRAKDVDCEYPQDARRTVVRTRKEDIIALQKQVEELKEQMLTQPRQSLSESVSSRLGTVQPEASPTLPQVEQSLPSDATPSSNSYLDVGSGSLVSGGTPLSSRRANRWSIPLPDAASVHSGPRASVAGASQDEGFPSAQQTPGEADSDEDSPQVYGAISLLYDQSSAIKLSTRQNQSNEDSSANDGARDRLIAYAAIYRQEEIALRSSPSLGMNIDFDGVPMDTAMHLLDLHWNRQHLSYLLTYRPAIMDSLINNGPNINKLLLNAIYLQSSLYSDRTSLALDLLSLSTIGTAFYERFKALLANYIDKPTLPTIVALLTCGACLVPRGKQSAGWVYCGMAYRMMTDLGYNLDLKITPESGAGLRLSVIEVEMRRRVYWGAYVNDKFQSLFLGRPPAMPESAGSVSQEYLDSYEEKEEWRPYVDPLGGTLSNPSSNVHIIAYPGRPTYALSTFRCLLQLCRIAAWIIEAFYSTHSPEIPKNSTPPPHQITPHTTYWTLIILTEQAFLDRRRFNFTLDPSDQEESRQMCIEAALQIWKLIEAYKKTFTLRRAQYGISYATYCAVLVLLQQTGQDSNTYFECIQFFWLALLEYQRGCSYGLKRPLRLLKSLMQRLEKVTGSMDVEMTTTNTPDISSFQAEMDSILGQNAGGFQDTDRWNEWWQGGVNQEDTIFGIADDTILGMYM
ncbi:hypothetical protein BHE90_002928 [Fusarium euwallaceae]|uniref:Zn(2)-C6 fungal-type domain-containing protein n=1 Tax=Fusarium euwallaceae TaxID=1147111 RepID=A0A430M3U7_9HYPO|nr:hypothetical protein BHE90_002928 [Fusarium euwallaceae]